MKVNCLIEKESLGIKEIEELMREKGIKVVGGHLRLVVNGRKYNIGRDGYEFPREIEEPLWRDVE